MVQESDTSGTDSSESREADNNARLNRQSIAAIIVALVVLGGGGLFLASRSEKTVPVTATTTTSVAPPRSTTTTIKKLPPGTSEIATVKGSVKRIVVRSQPPKEWLDSPEAVIPSALEDTPPVSQDTAEIRPPIPAVDDPVVGRYVVDGGWEFTNPGPYEPRQPLTFLVTERRGDWVQVVIPVRPNGTRGFVEVDDVDVTTTQQRIEIRLAEHKLVAYDGSDVIVDSPIVAGVGFSPTPTGVFYVTDMVPYKNPDGFYGPFALATSGYSEVLNEFDDGVPVLAIHGTNRPELMGEDRSNGCIRLPNDAIIKIADVLDLGVPVMIWP